MADTKRQQSKNAESQVNTRQDRNTFLTDGGTWTWDAGTGTLAWNAAARLHRGGVALGTILADSIVVGTFSGSTAYVEVDRSTGGGFLTMIGGGTIATIDNATDTRVVIGCRGSDGKFYFRNGTVMSDGDSKLFGQLNSVTDRNDITADGNALQNVGFTFVAASNQLAVYVGGILQTLGVEYVETGTTQVTFQPGYIPSQNERIAFVNIIGGEGPAATGTVSLQDAWSVDELIDVTSGNPVRIIDTGGGGALQIDNASVGLANIVLNGDGEVTLNSGSQGYTLRDGSLLHWWGLVPLDNGSGDLILISTAGGGGFLFEKSTGNLEFGSYAGAFPGGTWSGEGGVRWMVESGTLNAGTETDINIGVGLNILGVAVAFYDSGTMRWQLAEQGYGTDTSRRSVVTYDATSGDLTVSGFPGGSGAPGSGIDGEAYRIVVFYQG